MSWGAIIVGGVSLAAGAIAKSKAKKAQQKQEALANAQQPDAGIADYYHKALANADIDPYQSNFYQQAKQGANRNLATGIGALQDRRSAVGGLSSILAGSNNAIQNAGVGAEQMKRQSLGQLSQAAGANAQENKYPLEMKYNLFGAQAAGYNQAANAGYQGAYNAAGSVGAYFAQNKGNRNGSGNGASSTPNYLNYGQGE